MILLDYDKAGYQLLYNIPDEYAEKVEEYLHKFGGSKETPWTRFSVLTKTYKALAFDLCPRARYSSNIQCFVDRNYLYVFDNEFDKQKAFVYVQENRNDAADTVAASIKEMFNCNALKMEQIN